MMRSESTSALGQPRETKLTLGGEPAASAATGSDGRARTGEGEALSVGVDKGCGFLVQESPRDLGAIARKIKACCSLRKAHYLALPMSSDPNTPRDSRDSAPERRETYDREDARPGRTRTNIVVIAITVLLIGAGIWLAHVLADMRRVQDCLLSGRTNCAPLDVDSSSR
jgi:hypothetical protein